jgi:hypothetical protein
MWKKLSNRNKDWEVLFYSEWISLYHASLKLRDLNQNIPQPTIYNNLILSFVWEIYNKEYLLNLVGLSWEDNFTELEIIWTLFSKLGTKFVNYINGEFTIFIFDKLNKKYYLFRDRYWVHSVYYSVRNNELYFWSEIKTLILDKNFEFNSKAIMEYLIFQFSISPNTLIKDIFILKPWTFLEFYWWKYNIQSFWIYIPQNKSNNFLEVLEDSIKRRITKWIKKLFIPLSWGLDSNIILYFLKKHFKWEIISYTFYNKKNLEDLKVAKFNAKKNGIKNLSINLDSILNKDNYENIFIHEWLVNLINIWGIIRKKFPEYWDINIEFSGDWREELFLVNTHFNYKKILLKFKLLFKKWLIDKYEISQGFLNLNMFDFNLQLIEKLTLNNLIERRLSFTDYELLKFRGYIWYKNDIKNFLIYKWFKIVDWIYWHNYGIGFSYLNEKKTLLFLKHYRLWLIKNI